MLQVGWPGNVGIQGFPHNWYGVREMGTRSWRHMLQKSSAFILFPTWCVKFLVAICFLYVFSVLYLMINIPLVSSLHWKMVHCASISPGSGHFFGVAEFYDAPESNPLCCSCFYMLLQYKRVSISSKLMMD